MLINAIFTFCLFITICFANQAMQKPIKVFLQAQDEDAQEIQIPLESAQISSTIKNLVEDTEHNRTEDHINVSLSSVNSKLLSDTLIPCINAQQAGDSENIIKQKLVALTLDDLSSFIQAVNYLDIQPLFTKALDITQEKLKMLCNNKQSVTCFKNLNDIEHLLAYSLIKNCPIYTFIANPPKILKGCIKGKHKVDRLCFSNDNKFLATANWHEGRIWIWDTQTGNCLQTLDGHTENPEALCFSPDSSLFASGSRDGTAKIWHIATGNCLHTLKKHVYGNEPPNVWHVTFNHDGSLLATCAWGDPHVYLWNPKTGKFITALTGLNDIIPATVCCFNHNSSMLAVGYFNEIELWDLKTHSRLTPTCQPHRSAIKHIYFSCDDKHLISGTRYGDEVCICIWNTKTGDCLKKFHDRYCLFPGCYSVLINKLAIYRSPDTIDIFDLDSLTVQYSITPPLGEFVVCLAGSGYFDMKESALVLCSEVGNLYKGSFSIGESPKESAFVNIYENYCDELVSSCFSKDGSFLAVGYRDGTIKLFNFADKSLENYLAQQLTIDQALFLISFYEKLNSFFERPIERKQVVLCPNGHAYKILMSLDERIKKALERFVAKCSWKCNIAHYAKPASIAAGIGLTALGSYLLLRSEGQKK